MTAEASSGGAALQLPREARRRVSALAWKRPWLRLAALLTPPVAAFLLVYVAALASLPVSSFWSTDAFTGNTVHTWTLENFRTIFSFADPAYLKIAGRTIGIAAAVTVTDALVALPFAYFMARLASPRLRS